MDCHSGNAVDWYVGSARLGSQQGHWDTEGFHGFPQSFRQMPGQYLDWAMTASFQIRSNILFINHQSSYH
jgi:hypothetical protein